LRCLSCSTLSFKIFCKSCQIKLLTPNLYKREVEDLLVYSLFKYSDISEILTTKHTPIGYRVYKFLGKEILKPFIEEFIKNYNREVYIIGVDEKVKNGYSHIALLTHQLKMAKVKPLHSKLIAKSNITYSGKSREFREKNSREFIYSGKRDIEAILIDDIITTGTTLKEAKEVLERSGVDILFALTIASA